MTVRNITFTGFSCLTHLSGSPYEEFSHLQARKSSYWECLGHHARDSLRINFFIRNFVVWHVTFQEYFNVSCLKSYTNIITLLKLLFHLLANKENIRSVAARISNNRVYHDNPCKQSDDILFPESTWIHLSEAQCIVHPTPNLGQIVLVAYWRF